VLDVFVKVAAHIARGGKLEVIGSITKNIKPVKSLIPIVNNTKSQISGNVIYIDNYGNVITNITKKLFNSLLAGREFELHARNHKFNVIHDNYSNAINFN